MPNSILTLEDQRSPTWRKIKAYVQTELEIARRSLERDITPEQTAKLRGQIRSMNAVLALGDSQALEPVVEEEPD